MVADQVRDQMALDEVWLVVANHPWQKHGSRKITDAVERFEWVSAAVADVAGVEASDVELDIGGPSFTIDTLEVLTGQHPDVDWFIVLGSDAAAGLPTWHRADELRERAEFVVVNRPGFDTSPPGGWDISHVEIPALDISSTELRTMVARDRSIRFLVPLAVEQLVRASGAYR